MNIGIFTEGGKAIGMGHVTRCLSLYDGFVDLGITPGLFLLEGSPLNDLLPVSFQKIDWQNTKEIASLFEKQDVIIIDSYKAPQEIYDLATKTNKTIIAFDDDFRVQYPASIHLLNGAVGAEKLNYSQKEKHLLGLPYFPLRKELGTIKPKEYQKEIKNILITIGGADPLNLTPFLIKWIQASDSSIQLNVLITSNFEKSTEILALSSPTVQIHANLAFSDILLKMQAADVCISGGGQTLYELAKCGVPTIAVEVSGNQQGNIKGWMAEGFITEVLKAQEITEEKLIKAIQALNDVQKRKEIGQKGIKSVEKTNYKNAPKAILKIYFEEHLQIKKASEKEVELVFQLSNDPEVRALSFNQKPIEFQEHVNWYTKKIKDEKSLLLIGFVQDQFVGQLRFDILDMQNAYVGISITQAFRGRGISELLMQKGIEALKKQQPEIKTIIAYIKEENVGSQKYFAKCGFQFVKKIMHQNADTQEFHYIFV